MNDYYANQLAEWVVNNLAIESELDIPLIFTDSSAQHLFEQCVKERFGYGN